MSFGFFGIQFGFALQNANVSRIFETLGANVENIPILWIAAPVTGLIMQPIIGHMSDRTWTKLGRRRPFFLAGAILASIALLIMPNSPALWIAAGMLWIMDASINISMEPFRAFVGDMLPHDQRTMGFAMQSYFIGIGAFIASWLPYVFTNWFHIANTAPAGKIPPSVQYAFYIGGCVFLLSVLWTVFSTKEYPPEDLAEFEKSRKARLGEEKAASEMFPDTASKVFARKGIIWLLAGVILSLPVYFASLEKELYIFSIGLIIFGLLQMLAGYFKNISKNNGLTDIITDLYNMPQTMRQLAVVQFFSWFALFAMWIYTTPAVTSYIYGTTDAHSALYNEGANWVGGMFGYYNLFAAAFSFLLPVLAKYTNRKITHAIALVAGGIGLLSFYFIRNPSYLIFSMIGIGLAWASILAMPYAILTGALPQKKMGVYMGIFNFFIVIPQILAASILGFFTKTLFSGHAIYAILLGGASMIVAAFTVLLVNDK
jgi:maltose/moltooligosaccharide transporter